MHVILPKVNEIYSRKTSEYFNEILSSYSNGNYRSAIVMLYSITIVDLLNKLKEMSDMYDDKKSKQILDKINQSRQNKGKSKSLWEKELIDTLHEETKFLNLEQYVMLHHLYEYRNFCAHPAMNDDYELITPTKEITIAHIRNILENILVKSPVFINDIFNSLVEDLEEKASHFEGFREYEHLKSYLVNKYFSRMTDEMVIKTFDILWKFIFIKNDERINKNRKVNRKALEILFEYKFNLLNGHIGKKCPYYDGIPANDNATKQLIVFISRYPNLYEILGENTKHSIEKTIDADGNMKLISWFTKESKLEHIKGISSIYDFSFDTGYIEYFIYKYIEDGYKEELIDLFIKTYGESGSFDSANYNYEKYIKPYTEDFTTKQIEKIIEKTDQNTQIWKRNNARICNDEMMNVFKEKIDKDFDFSKYSAFDFNEKILN